MEAPAAPPPGTEGPLAGVKVIDLTTVVMGPFATQILGDMGAEVIKVESVNGDSLRGVGPWRHPGMGPLFLQNNRNKQSITLDLKHPDDLAKLGELAGEADVLISNIRPAGMARLGLTNETIRAINPSIIICNAVGYGSGGRLAGRAVYDDLIQAGAGIAGLFGAVDGAPRYAPFNVADRVAALYIAIAVNAALYRRSRSGLGEDIEVPMFETIAQFVLADHMGGGAFIPPLGPMGYPRLLSRHRGPYPTKDGHITVVLYTNEHWQRFLGAIGKQGLLEEDERFSDQQSRNMNSDEVGRFLEEQFLGSTTEEWLRVLAELDIPASKVNGIEDLLTDEHLQDVDFFRVYEHPTEGTVRTTRFPVRFAYSPATRFTPPMPLQGLPLETASATGQSS